MTRPMRETLIFLLAAALSACAVGPNYHRPPAPTPTHFKEADGWKPAEPREAASGTAWWSVYEDATLDALEKQVEVSNQTLKASEAAWREAVAVAQVAGAQIYPTTTINATAQRSRGTVSTFTSTNPNGGAGTRPAPVNEFAVNGSASWDLDLWGRIRRTI